MKTWRRWIAGLLVFALAWVGGGLLFRGRVLAAWRTDYEVAAIGKQHPILARLVLPEQAAQASELFALHYEGLESANVLTAPIHAALTVHAHKGFADVMGSPARGESARPASGARVGLVVSDVVAGSRAERSGVVVGDVLISYNGFSLARVADLDGAQEGAAGFFPSRVWLVVERGGQQMRLPVETGKLGLTCARR